MITSEVIQQVFLLRTKLASGTGFTVKVDGKQYLITARHVLEELGSSAIPAQPIVEINRGGTWHSFTATLVFSSNAPWDIAVLALPVGIGLSFPEVDLGTKGLIYGQETYFLGFPFGWRGEFGAVNNDYPVPYVKRAIVSMLSGQSSPMVVLDGVNNPGFSGGPVAFKNQAGKWQIAAVVSGFNTTREPVFKGKSDESAGLTVDQNTGLIDASPLEIVLKPIRANPLGPMI
jgi:hypothetical protein